MQTLTEGKKRLLKVIKTSQKVIAPLPTLDKILTARCAWTANTVLTGALRDLTWVQTDFILVFHLCLFVEIVHQLAPLNTRGNVFSLDTTGGVGINEKTTGIGYASKHNTPCSSQSPTRWLGKGWGEQLELAQPSYQHYSNARTHFCSQAEKHTENWAKPPPPHTHTPHTPIQAIL